MEFQPTSLADARLVCATAVEDERGHFARIRCAEEFAEHGLPRRFVQTSLSYNRKEGTFRGLHYQVAPSNEAKLVRCVTGAIDDIIVDIRPESPTFLKHEWFRISAANLRALYVPPGFAHGFLTAEDNTTILYEMTDLYSPDLYRGIRWSDPALSVEPPRIIEMINSRDSNYPDLDISKLGGWRVGVRA